MDKIIVKWLGHSCFKLTCGDWTAVIDPYENKSVPGLKNIEESAIAVFSSHDHYDHNATGLVRQIRMYAPAPVITKVESFHDNAHGALRGKNTIHIFEYGGMRLAHFGDLGHTLTQEQIDLLGKVDIALIPVGGFYTINAVQAKEVIDQIEAKIVVPMHYKTDSFGFGNIANIKEFTDLCDNVVYIDSDTLEIDKNTPAQTAVLWPSLAEKA